MAITAWLFTLTLIWGCYENPGKTDTGCMADLVSRGYVFGVGSFNYESSPIEDPFHIDARAFEKNFTITGSTEAEFKSSFMAAVGEWNTAASGLRLNLKGDTGVLDTSDHTVTVYPGSKSDLYAGDDGDTYADTSHTDGPHYYSCDIMFYRDVNMIGDSTSTPQEVPWATVNVTDKFNIKLLFEHELGHCIGLSDNDLYTNFTQQVAESIMVRSFAGDPSQIIYPIDKEALGCLY